MSGAPATGAHGVTEAHDRLLELHLADADVPCPGCGYNLRGLHGNRCPECDEPLALTVSLIEAHSAAWLAAVIALTCGAGAAGVGLLLVVVLSIHFGDMPPAPLFWIPGAALLLEGALAAALLPLGSRRWFRTLTPQRRRTLALICWLLTAGFAVVLVKYLTSL